MSSFPAWPGSLESRGEVVGACFSMGSHLSILLYSPQRNLLFREGFPPHGSPAAQMKPGFFLSDCTLVPGISTEVEQLVSSRRWQSVLLVGPSPCGATRTTPSVSEPLHECVLTCVHTCAVTAIPRGLFGTSPLDLRCCIALCHRCRQNPPPHPPGLVCLETLQFSSRL